MTYRNILLHLDANPECAHRINATLDLASRLDAHVTGLAVAGITPVPFSPEMAASAQIFAEVHEHLYRQAEGAAQRFESTAQQQGYVQVETRVVSERELDALTLEARYADLIVIGQRDPANGAPDSAIATPGDVVLACPRPVLVIPYIGAPAGFGKHVLIAWNGSREACRAVTDALPLLKLAERVTVMAVDPEISDQAHGPSPGEDLAKFLARHDVKITVDPDYGEVDDTGSELLSRATDLGADLIVMGAYGHSRAREWVFGGVTRTILGSMTVPVLMSH